MNKETFFKALEIISKHNSSEIVINQPINDFVGDLGTSKWTIHIKICAPAVIDELKQEGFSLGMGEHGLSVSKF